MPQRRRVAGPFHGPAFIRILAGGAGPLLPATLLGIGGRDLSLCNGRADQHQSQMIGEFTLAQFGPTEFKTLLSIYGLALTVMLFSGSGAVAAETVARCFFGTLIVFGVVQLTVNLWLAIRQVNQHRVPPDTSEWVTAESNSDSDRVKL